MARVSSAELGSTKCVSSGADVPAGAATDVLGGARSVFAAVCCDAMNGTLSDVSRQCAHGSLATKVNCEVECEDASRRGGVVQSELVQGTNLQREGAPRRGSAVLIECGQETDQPLACVPHHSVECEESTGGCSEEYAIASVLERIICELEGSRAASTLSTPLGVAPAAPVGERRHPMLAPELLSESNVTGNVVPHSSLAGDLPALPSAVGAARGDDGVISSEGRLHVSLGGSIGSEDNQPIADALPPGHCVAQVTTRLERASLCDSGAASPVRRDPVSASWLSRREKLLATCLRFAPPSNLGWSERMTAAARFIAHVFTRLRHRWCAGLGRIRWPCVWRPVVISRCCNGLNLAPRCEFEEQARLAETVFDWDREHVRLLRRLDSGSQPLILDLFCAAGGVSEGFRRMHCTSVGVDASDQPGFVARFGERCFELGSALDRDRLRRLVRELRPIAIWASPPCEGSSTLTFGGEPSTAERLIAQTRDALVELGLPFVIENVLGASSELLSHAIVVRGQEYGLETERPRLLEAGGGLVLSHCAFLAEGGARLRARCCLGARARYDRLDRFGMRFRAPCCGGNIFAVMGDAPRRSTLEENARAMGLDVGHMPFGRMAKAIPPAYACAVVGQIVRHVLRTRFGVPALSYDEALLDMSRARRQLDHWGRGAGGVSQLAGLELVSRVADVEPELDISAARPAGCASAGADNLSWTVTDVATREIDLSWAGGFDQSIVSPGGSDWLRHLRPIALLDPGVDAISLVGRNTFIHVTRQSVPIVADALRRACELDVTTRAAVVCSDADLPVWRASLVPGSGLRLARLFDLGGPRSVGGHEAERLLVGATRAAVFAVGERVCTGGLMLDHSSVEIGMDPMDLGIGVLPKAWKHAVSHSEYPPPPIEAWRGLGFPASVLEAIEHGVRIEPFEAPIPKASGSVDPSRLASEDEERVAGRFYDELGMAHVFQLESGQYAYPDAEHFQMGVAECDRALLVGHLEPVPAHLVDHALSVAAPHPWSIVHQSEDKWRAAQDYSQFTNRRVGSKPFTMTSVDDAVRVVKPASHFAKYDLRDGFWAIKVEPSSRPWLMVRHPATGRLLWCTSLPFGYKLSPYHFCEVTESVAQVFRSRVAGRGIYVFVFVDDFLIVGDDEDLTREGMAVLEALLDELGLQWARHKRRGPARVVEFLGHLLVNLSSELQVVALTRTRQERLIRLLSVWMERRSVASLDWEECIEADPRELASLLGHLVFCSEVVPGGRTYMQAMLRQFAGLEVDWMRGRVRYVQSAWGSVQLQPGFWRDLAWWRSALAVANCSPMHSPSVGLAAIVGTDASDEACGELAWVDGTREEMVLRFTEAERRRPINFRELLGVLRLVERWGARLRGCTLLIDIDNTAAVGASTRMFSKAEDMQELVRRLLELAVRHGLTLRPVHTPGATLIRPDQTSRGFRAEEPRQRFSRRVFSQWEARYGPFTEYLGAERGHPSEEGVQGGGPPRLWVHPTHATVAAALGRIGERLTVDPSTCPRGLVVVPWAPEAAWWRLTRHFECVARLPIGSRHLEESRGGVWLPISSRRPTAVFAFPRVSGTALPLSLLCELGDAEAAGERAPFTVVGISPARPLPRGAMLYATLRAAEGETDSDHVDAGCLYLTLREWDGAANTSPECGWLRRASRQRGPAFDVFTLERGTAMARGGSYASGLTGFYPDTSELWLCNEFCVQTIDRGRGSSSSLRVRFDFSAAEREVSRRRDGLALESVRALVSQPAQIDAEVLRLARAALLDHERTRAAAEAATREETGDEDASVRPMSGLRARRDTDPPPPAFLPAGYGMLVAESAGRPAFLDPSSTRRARRVALSVSGQLLVRVPYAGMTCAGCRDPLVGGQVTSVTPGGSGMIHNARRCLDLARREMAREAAEAAATALAITMAASTTGAAETCCGVAATSERATEGVPQRPVRCGSSQRRTQLGERIGEARRLRVRQCLEGRCGVHSEVPMVCLGVVDGAPCPARLHGVQCAQLTRGQAALGCFRCAACRMRCMAPGVDLNTLPPVALQTAEATMLLELSSGAEATGGSFHDVLRMQTEFMAGPAGIVGSVMPLDDAEVFKMFLTWIVTSKERALSLDSLFRVAGIVMNRTTRENLTKRGDVKAHFSSLQEMHGEEAQPRTAATRRMISYSIETAVPRRCRDKLVCVRTQLDIAMEVMLGLRVGEALGGGDVHGLLANHVTILRRLDEYGLPTGEEYVEAMLEHSKTKHQRYVTAVGLSKGAAQVPLARLVREYWALAGFDLIVRDEGGYRVTGPDYYVIRVSLTALADSREGDQQRLNLMADLLSRSECAEARRWAEYTRLRGMGRLLGDSADRRYINVVGGFKDCDAIRVVSKELTIAGFGAWMSLEPGPFMRATHGKALGLAHMPIQPGSTYGALHDICDDAHAATHTPLSPDPELDLQGRATPLWAHHSWRRAADTFARQTMSLTEVSEADIDLVFGWMEAFYGQKMQRHYESHFDRLKRAAVTSMI